MFTGIVETTGVISQITEEGTNKTFWVKSKLSNKLKVDQSVSHNGVCLTVEEVKDDMHRVTAILETLEKTNLHSVKEGTELNLERCLRSDGRFDGHIVQGHVDQTGHCCNITSLDGSTLLDFEYNPEIGNITVEKGSICINGVSLTVFNSSAGKFSVAIIPYTWEHTNFKDLKISDEVNLEFDIIGKYVAKLLKPFQ